MKILYITKHTGKTKINADLSSLSNQSIFSKSSTSDSPFLDLLEKLMENIKKLDSSQDKPAVKKWKGNSYYFMVSGENAYGFVIDELISVSKIYTLFDKIKLATDAKQLQQLIADPIKATETKSEIIRKELDNIKDLTMESIDKVIARGKAIDKLTDQAQFLQTTSVKFKKGSTDVKISMMPWYSRLFYCFISPYTALSETFSTAPSTPKPVTKTTNTPSNPKPI
jgi:hypothetical protein